MVLGLGFIVRRRARISRPGTKDEFGDRLVPDTSFWDITDWIVGIPVASDVGSGGSIPDGKQNRVSTFTQCWILGETLAQPNDLVEIDGVTYQVTGHPGRAESPFTGRLGGYQVTVRKYEG